MKYLNYRVLLIFALLLTLDAALGAQTGTGAAISGPLGADTPRAAFVRAAQSYLGTSYLSGGNNRTGMDCSGLVYRASLDSMPRPLPRTVAALAAAAEQIPIGQAESGDLLFFNTVGALTHVGIYLGDGKFVHAASEGPRTGVIVSSLTEPYWKRTFAFSGRILTAEQYARTGQTPSAGGSWDTDSSTENSLPVVYPFEGSFGLRVGFTGAVLWDFMPGETPIRGGIAMVRLSWMRGMTVFPGIIAGFSADNRSESLSFPLAASLSHPSGFSFFLGTQLHLTASSSLNKAAQFPGLLGLSWESKPARLGRQNIRFYQDFCYSNFPNETFSAGVRFTSGLTLSYDL